MVPSNNKTALIAGGSGLIGQHLAMQFESKGYGVKFLSRSAHPERPGYFRWDPDAGYIDPHAFDGVDILVNLAGENLADKLWTPWRRRKIVNSRVLTTRFLKNTLRNIPNQVEVVINASAIGIYGNTGDRILHEDAPLAGDFLGMACQRWEGVARQFEDAGIRTVILRFGLVLSRQGGLFPRLMQPLHFGIAPVLGNGEQYQSWIHIDDLCRMIVKSAREQQFRGVYNAVSPGSLSQRNFMKLLSQISGGNHLLLPVPAFLLKLALGELSKLLTEGCRVSPEKMERTGFKFNFPQAHHAFKNLLGK